VFYLGRIDDGENAIIIMLIISGDNIDFIVNA